MSARYGEWTSPLSAADAARAAARFGNVHLGSTRVVWSEMLPGDGGRMAIKFSDLNGADGEPGQPQEFRRGHRISARSRINEYGGGSFWRGHGGDRHDASVFWVDSETQRIHLAQPEGHDTVITPEPHSAGSWRYAAGVVFPGDEWMIVEREAHVTVNGSRLPEPVHDLVALRTDGSKLVRLLGPTDNGGGDFVACPRLSPDGCSLAWLRWDHPDMPWDAAELWAGSVVMSNGTPVLVDERRIAGGRPDSRSAGLGRAVSVCLPEWSPDGVLWWCDDSDDWWNLHHASSSGLPLEADGDESEPIMAGLPEEVGEPRWVSGGCRYGFVSSSEVVFVASSRGLDGLWVANLATGERTRVAGPEFSYVESISVSGDKVAAIAGSPLMPTSVWLIDLTRRTAVDLRRSKPVLAHEWISCPESIEFETEGGATCHGLLYRPKGVGYEPPDGDLPPLLVRIHGGPTASARSEFSTSVQFWTTRGFAVIDVNYRGSTGFGRRYRDQLLGEWGVADVKDCIAAAKHLSDTGIVDPRCCVIRGGSSGGFTALAAICFQEAWGRPDTLAAACSLYGVTDLAALARDTHKFESHYLDGLVGSYPEQAEIYTARSPLHNARKLTKPVLILQGSDDRIVPRSQAEVLVDAMASNGVPHAYVLFDGEGHGFVNGETVARALELELTFYGLSLGFRPAGQLPDLVLS